MERQRRMSLIEEGGEPQVRMAYLAIVGSFSVNGVAALHSELLKQGPVPRLLRALAGEVQQQDQRRHAAALAGHVQPGLRELLDETIGEGWVNDLDSCGLAPKADDPASSERWDAIKRATRSAWRPGGRACGSSSRRCMFDVQVKRIHEYKRQLLNVLHVIHLYNRIKRGDTDIGAPRCVLIGGKAAPGYEMAKLIIKLINNVAKRGQRDPRGAALAARGLHAGLQRLGDGGAGPGTDLSEQISTAGKEASGTGNMKFMMNGAVTIGTLDGANIEIREQVGEDNFFLFGLTAEERPVDDRGGLSQLHRCAGRRGAGLAGSRRLVRRCILNRGERTLFLDRTIREYGRDIWFRDQA
jgi:starch phosphorylase